MEELLKFVATNDQIRAKAKDWMRGRSFQELMVIHMIISSKHDDTGVEIMSWFAEIAYRDMVAELDQERRDANR